MLKEIDETSWKSTLQKRDKKNCKNMELSQVLQMFVDTSADIFRQILEVKLFSDITKHLTNIELLRKYFNDSICKISTRYSCCVPYISDNWLLNNIKV